MAVNINNPELFGRHIHALRKRAGLSIKELAAKLDVDWRLIRVLEGGNKRKHGIAVTSWSEELMEQLTEILPGFSRALAPGVDPPPLRRQHAEDDIRMAKKLL